MRLMVSGIAALGLAASLLCVNASAQDYAATRAQSLYRQLRNEAECEAALPQARAFWSSPDFNTLTAQSQLALLGAMTICAVQLEDSQFAVTVARGARAYNAAWADRVLLSLGLQFEDDALAVRSFMDLTRSNAAAIPELEESTVWRVLRAAARSDPTGAAEVRIHDALVLYKFEPSDEAADESMRFQHASALLRTGQVDRARSRIGVITNPRNVVAIRVTKLFDPLREAPTFEASLDVAAAAEADLERLRRISAENPRRLGSLDAVSRSLRALGRNDEALAVMDAALAAAADPAHFEDYEEQINWAHNERAYVLYALNRPVEARAAFGEAIAVGEHGDWNVSQVINFASMLSSEGRARDALEVVRTVGRASTYGDMWAASVRACASSQIDDQAVLSEAMAFLRANENENPAALSSALLCSNDLDGAAALFVRRLSNPTHMEGALLALQRVRQAETTPLVRDALMEQRLEQVRNRPDVRAAVDAVGRIEEVPLYSVYWGDI